MSGEIFFQFNSFGFRSSERFHLTPPVSSLFNAKHTPPTPRLRRTEKDAKRFAANLTNKNEHIVSLLAEAYAAAAVCPFLNMVVLFSKKNSETECFRAGCDYAPLVRGDRFAQQISLPCRSNAKVGGVF
jgi:hypothetical protein